MNGLMYIAKDFTNILLRKKNLLFMKTIKHKHFTYDADLVKITF